MLVSPSVLLLAQKILLNLNDIEIQTIDAALEIENEFLSITEQFVSYPILEPDGICSARVQTYW